MSEHQQTQKTKESKPIFQKQKFLRSTTRVSNSAAIIQRARISPSPRSLTPADVLQLQRTIGNRAVGRLLSEIRNPSEVQQAPIQRQKLEEEETCPSCVQRQEMPEEEEPLQGVFENKPEQAACPSCIQRRELEEEEPLQTKRENKTGMPDSLKAGVENLSGIDMSDVRVHYNSSKPAEVGALAYTQGTNIYVAPGQERHLPHEAWHVVQQAQGRVRPMTQMAGIALNNDNKLEREANVLGNLAMTSFPIKQLTYGQDRTLKATAGVTQSQAKNIQCKVNSFVAHTGIYDPPGTDLIETIDTDDFQESEKFINARIRNTLNDPLIKELEFPKIVKAVLEKDPNDKNPERKLTRSRNIGLIGRDEFFIRSGKTVENFEGGHLIPHALWNINDPNVDKADGYQNLVPMSRTMNVMDWANREERFIKKLEDIPFGDELEATISIEHKSYHVTLKEIADRFGLTLDPAVYPKKEIELYGWLPVSAEPAWKHLKTGSEGTMSIVEENALRNTADEITNFSELVTRLKQTPIWKCMTPALRHTLKHS